MLLVQDGPLGPARDHGAAPRLFDAPARVAVRLLAHDAHGHFGFTPDGAWAVFLSQAEGLVAVPPLGKHRRLISGAPPAGMTIAQDASPAGKLPQKEGEPAPTPRPRQRLDSDGPIEAKPPRQAPAYFEVTPDSQTIVYGTYEGNLYAASLAGGRPMLLTPQPLWYPSPTITPDSAWVAITPIGGPVTLTSIDGRRSRPFLDSHPLGMVFRFAGNDLVVYRGPQHVFVRAISGGTPRDITTGLPRSDLYDVVDGAAVVGSGKEGRMLYLAPLDGSGPLELERRVSWPPHRVGDGRGFAYHDPQYNLLYVDARTRTARQVNRPLRAGEQVWPFFASTGALLVYDIIAGMTQDRGRHHELHVVALDGSFDRVLAVVPDADTVIAQPTANNKNVIVHAHSDTDRMAVFVIALDSGQITRLTPLWPGWANFVVSPSSRHALVMVPRPGSTRPVTSDLYIIDLP